MIYASTLIINKKNVIISPTFYYIYYLCPILYNK